MHVCEIFESIQGEATNQGRVTTFVRLANCNLDCSYCDTKYARNAAEIKEMSIEEVLDAIEVLDNKLVEITGGEPLLQYASVLALTVLLLSQGYEVDLETNGTINTSNVPPGVRLIMDFKTPGSKMHKKAYLDCLKELCEKRELCKKDDLKFVVTSKEDMEWSKQIIERYKPEAKIYFSPCIGYGDITLADVAAFVIKNKHLGIRYSLQVHKYIWDPKKRGV